MKVMNMIFQNYGSFYGEHMFSFADRGIALIMGENHDEPRMKSNGAGKTTIGDALEWCWFGDPPRGDNADSVVNTEAGKGLSVTSQVLDDDGKLIQIQRTRGVKGVKDGPRVWVNGDEKYTTLDGSKTQEHIEGLLGLDHQVFRAAVLFAQHADFCLAEATDSQWKEILTKVCQLEEVDAHADTLTRKLDAKEKAHGDIAVELSNLRFQISDTEGNVARANDAAAHWEADRQQRVQNAQLGEQNARAEVERLHAALSQISVVAPPASTNVPPPPQLVAIDTFLAQVQQRLQAANTDIGAERARYTSTKKRYDLLAQKGAGTCSECGQPVSEQHVAQEKVRLVAELEASTVTGKGLAVALQQIEQERAQANYDRQQADAQWRAAQQQQSAHDALARQAYAQGQQTQQAAQRALASHTYAKQQVDRAMAEVNPHAAIITTGTQRLQQMTASRTKLEAAAAVMNIELAHLKFWKIGFGPKGLKSYVLDARLEEMTTEANRWVQLLTGGTIWVRFETQKQVGAGTKKKLSETFSVRVFRHNPDGTITERNFRSWSGGEKHRIALGIDFGLARLVAKRSARRYDLLILDEVFQKSLDSSGKEAVAEMLQHLAAEKSTILVIDHDVIFQGLFEEVIVVEKKNGRSKIKGAAHGDESGAA